MKGTAIAQLLSRDELQPSEQSLPVSLCTLNADPNTGCGWVKTQTSHNISDMTQSRGLPLGKTSRLVQGDEAVECQAQHSMFVIFESSVDWCVPLSRRWLRVCPGQYSLVDKIVFYLFSQVEGPSLMTRHVYTQLRKPWHQMISSMMGRACAWPLRLEVRLHRSVSLQGRPAPDPKCSILTSLSSEISFATAILTASWNGWYWFGSSSILMCLEGIFMSVCIVT